MNNTKQQLNLRKINQKIKGHEQNIFNLEKQIQEEKSSLGSIIANNREAAPLLVKGAKAISGMLFGIGLPYAFTGNGLFASIAFASSLISYGIYTVGTRLDKHDKIWRKKCLRRIEELKDKAKESKIVLHELYQKSKYLEEYGEVTKDTVLEEEIRKDLEKQSYQLVRKKFIKSQEQKQEIEC